MTTQPDNATTTVSELARCLHRTPAGRRCRSEVIQPGMQFCQRHAYLHAHLPIVSDLSPELLGDLREIEFPEDIRGILSKLFFLLAQDRIPQKKAAVLTYILQQLLRSLTVIERQALLQNEKSEPAFQIDLTGMPRPNFSNPSLNQSPEAITS